MIIIGKTNTEIKIMKNHKRKENHRLSRIINEKRTIDYQEP